MKTFARHIFMCIVYCGLILSFTQCTDHDDAEIKFTNLTSEAIYVTKYVTDDDPDTMLATLFYIYDGDRLVEILPGETVLLHIIQYPFYSEPARSYLVFTKNTLDNYSVDQIVRNNIYDALYTYEFAELKALNFQLSYPQQNGT